MNINYLILFAGALYAYRKKVKGVNCLYLDILRDLFINIYGYFRVRSFLVDKVEFAISRVIRLRIEGVSPRFLNCDYVVHFQSLIL
jgi:hypothetical protein